MWLHKKPGAFAVTAIQVSICAIWTAAVDASREEEAKGINHNEKKMQKEILMINLYRVIRQSCVNNASAQTLVHTHKIPNPELEESLSQ